MEGVRMVCGETEEEKRQRGWALPLICEANRPNEPNGANERLLYFFASSIKTGTVGEEDEELVVNKRLTGLCRRNSYRNNTCGLINCEECC